jgi:RNA polymerase sigma factor (sigma-70 family)
VDTGGAPLDGGRRSQGGTAISTVTAVPALRRDGEDITANDLVARIRAGDDRAFEKLYTRYQRRIASYIQGMVHDHARAEDIAQDVFMSALRRMRDTDRPIAFKPWIYEIAKNACIDQFRRARRAEEVSMDADEGLGSADYGRLVSSTPTPDVAHDHKQQIDHLKGAFGGLSETHHEILVMRELEGLSYREIGEKLGMTRPAVESTLFRARRRLTEEYDQLVTGERCVRVQQIIAQADGTALGARDKRRVARHVSYCQPCLRQARVSGIDARDLVQPTVRQKIAAFLPLPAFLKERWGTPDVQASLASWSTQASAVDPGLISTWGKAAATAATIALAGVSAGVATNDGTSGLRNVLGGVTLDSITGESNPGGSSSSSSSSSDVQAGQGGSSSTAAGGGSSSKGAGSTGAGSSATQGGTGSGSGAAGAPADGSAGQNSEGPAGGDGDGVGSIAGVGSDGSGANPAGGAGAGSDGTALIPSLGEESSDGGTSNGNGKGNGGKDDGGDDAVLPSVDVGASVPSVPAPSGGAESDSSGGAGKDDPADGGSPVTGIGEKTGEVIGGLTGG